MTFAFKPRRRFRCPGETVMSPACPVLVIHGLSCSFCCTPLRVQGSKLAKPCNVLEALHRTSVDVDVDNRNPKAARLCSKAYKTPNREKGSAPIPQCRGEEAGSVRSQTCSVRTCITASSPRLTHGCFFRCSVSTGSACPIVLVNRPGSLPMSSIVYKLSTTFHSSNHVCKPSGQFIQHKALVTLACQT